MTPIGGTGGAGIKNNSFALGIDPVTVILKVSVYLIRLISCVS